MTGPGHTRPQNKSCPAGGTKTGAPAPAPSLSTITDKRADQRGVIVAPPSGNTFQQPITVLHRGFDTLALAIRTNIPADLFDYLEAEKERADQERREILIDYNGVKLHLKAHGGNGYRFIASGGQDGATWFFKKPNTKDKWGIRLSFGSYFMAVHGLGRAKAHVEAVLERLGIQHGPDDISISRADFCVDLLAPGFVLIPDQFVMHSAAGRRDHVTDTEKSVNGKSGRTTSVTIGSSRNRQAIVYDKRAEVIAHSKSYWWGIWNHTLAQIGPDRTLLSPDPAQADANRVIRVEFRAGKDLLKDTWGIRTWAQFFDRFGDLCRQSGQVIRYTQPVPGDSNRARWPDHPLWDAACEAMNDDLAEMRSGADPNPLKAVQREDHINMLFRNVLGTSITLGALMGVGFDDLPATLADLAKRMRAELAKNPDKTAKQLQAAKDRYVFIGETDATLQAR